MLPYLKCILTVHLFIGLNLMALAQSDIIVKSTSDFELTGKGDSHNWTSVNWINIPARSEGETRKTLLKCLYSETGMYFLFECEDQIITSTLREDNADLWTEDVVEVFLWTDENYHFYFEYELSPYNYELPIIVPNVKGKFFGWLPWQYEGDRRCRRATHIHQEGNQVTKWTAEMFIPYALLKPMGNVPPKPDMKWRANFYRFDHDNGVENRWEWQPVNRNFHDYKGFGTLIFE